MIEKEVYNDDEFGYIMKTYDNLPREVRDLYKEYCGISEFPEEAFTEILKVCGYVPNI